MWIAFASGSISQLKIEDTLFLHAFSEYHPLLAMKDDCVRVFDEHYVLQNPVLLMINLSYLHDHTSTEIDVNKAWKQLFSQKGRSMHGL